MADDRSDDGRFTERSSDEDVLDATREHSPAATSEVADELGVTRQAADYRLRKLRDEDRVASKKIGASLVWYVPDEDVETDPGPSPGLVDHPEDDQEANLDQVDFPQGKDRERCEDAVLAARDHIAAEGSATMREIVSETMPDHPLGYDVGAALAAIESGDRYRGAWWRRVVKPGLEALEEIDKPARGQSRWRHVGDR